jgi:hypothetical protein
MSNYAPPPKLPGPPEGLRPPEPDPRLTRPSEEQLRQEYGQSDQMFDRRNALSPETILHNREQRKRQNEQIRADYAHSIRRYGMAAPVDPPDPGTPEAGSLPSRRVKPKEEAPARRGSF